MVDEPARGHRERSEPAAGPGETVGPDIGDLITACHGDVYRYAYRLCGQQADAEDLTQQTFLVAQQRLHQLRDAGKAANWLFAILRNCYLKSQAKRQPIPAASLELEIDSIPEEVSDEDIDRAQLQAAIDELPDEFKLVLVMFYFQECSYKEIAAELGISIGTVMSRLSRAKGRLRSRLVQADGEQEPPTVRPTFRTVEPRAICPPPEAEQRTP